MASRRPSPAHQEAVSRRLAQLHAELSTVRDPDATRLRGSPPVVEPDEPDEHTRVSPRPQRERSAAVPPAVPPTAPERPPPDAAPVVPRPGRHAARRAGGGVGVVPATLRGRVALGPAQLALVAVLVAVGLAVTAWWVIRGDAHEVAAPVLAPVAAGPAEAPATGPAALATPVDGSAAGSGGGEPAGKVTVDVTGKVHDPGVVVLDAGSRVIDALEAAGGPRRGVDLSSLNLARVLVDGEQVVVGRAAPPAVAGSVPVTTPGAGPLVNLNTADLAQLETLPDVGPVTAQAIVDWRTQHGGFTDVAELLEVDGIGDATLATLRPHVTV